MTLNFSLAKQYEAEGKLVLAAKHYQLVIDNYSSSLLVALLPFTGLSKATVDLEYQKAKAALARISINQATSDADLNAIGVMYATGSEVQTNDIEALRWKRLAREKGSAVAIRSIGIFYEFGRVVDKNRIIAAQHYQQAIEKGYEKAKKDLKRLADSANELDDYILINIGDMYFNAIDVQRSYANALIWYQYAANKGSVIAFRNLGVLHEQHGYGVTKNIILAMKYYQRAKEKGCKESQGDIERINNDETITAADMNSIGAMYHDGKLVTQDYLRAKFWYEKAKRKYYAPAYRNLGVLYQQGFGVHKDILTAVRNYQQALDRGYKAVEKDLNEISVATLSAEDANEIGDMYLKVMLNYKKALECYQVAEKKGSALAKRNIGWLYERGLGVVRNVVLAVKYYRQAVENSFAQAQIDINRVRDDDTISSDDLKAIGDMYHAGKDVKQDDAKAAVWYKKAKKPELANRKIMVGSTFFETDQKKSETFWDSLKFHLQDPISKGLLGMAGREVSRQVFGPPTTAGMTAGVVFQGIMSLSDWYTMNKSLNTSVAKGTKKHSDTKDQKESNRTGTLTAAASPVTASAAAAAGAGEGARIGSAGRVAAEAKISNQVARDAEIARSLQRAELMSPKY